MQPREILDLADSCVKCGLCLPYCPTYRLTRDEADSPRGRISLIQGMLSGNTAVEVRGHHHLQRCLLCLACERFCPSEVAYGEILNQTRAWRVARQSALKRTAGLAWLDLLTHAGSALELGRRLPQRVTTAIPALAGALRTTAAAPGAALPALSVPQGAVRGHVALFTGCVGRELEKSAHAAALRVLALFGYRVSVPPETCCCGALHLHEGFAAEGRRRRQASAALFSAEPYDAVLGLASACTAEMAQSAAGAKFQDLTRFLADLQWPGEIRFDTTPLSVRIHVPCSQRNALGDADAALDLLAKLPGLKLSELADNASCCGAAGAFMLRESALSRALIEQKMDAADVAADAVVVTTNTGCRLQLAAELQRRGINAPVLHPVELLARRLAPESAPLEAPAARVQNPPKTRP